MSTFALSPCQPAGSSSQPWRNIGSPGASHVAAKNAATQVAGCDSLLAQASPLEGSFACNQRSEFRQGPGGEVVERFPCWLPSGEVEASFYSQAILGPRTKTQENKEKYKKRRTKTQCSSSWLFMYSRPLHICSEILTSMRSIIGASSTLCSSGGALTARLCMYSPKVYYVCNRCVYLSDTGFRARPAAKSNGRSIKGARM